MRALLLAAILSACAAPTQVGPFVKHVQRNGDFLVVHKCIIILDGDDLREGGCAAEQIPLRSLPMAPQPPAGMTPPSVPQPMPAP